LELSCACCGNMTIDDLVFHDGSTRMGVLGGDAVYGAIGASLWGITVALISVAGPDYPVSRLSESFGIRTTALITKSRPSLRNWGLYEKDGTRQFIFRGPKDQWADYSPRPEDIPADMLKGSFFHCAPVPWDMQIDLLRHARASGARFISVDPAYQYLDGISDAELGKLLRHADAFLPSRQEVRAMYPGATPDEALDTLIRHYPALSVIVMKLGEEGAIGYDRACDARFRIPVFPARAVDQTGAGDSFCGGFIAGYALCGDARRAALHGAVAASFVVETEGTLGLAGITRAMAESRLSAMGGNT
jgi:sugar/nucleoside kinase (ribokinase family)